MHIIPAEIYKHFLFNLFKFKALPLLYTESEENAEGVRHTKCVHTKSDDLNDFF